jgi:hypothetical protein
VANGYCTAVCGSSGQHRECDRRRVLATVVDHVVRDEWVFLVVVVATGVKIAFEAGKVAARHLDPDAVSW